MVKFAIVGTNFISDWFMSGAAHDNRFELSAVYSRQEATAQAFIDKYAVRYGNVRIFTDFDEFVSSDSYTAAYVASPNILHHEQSLKLIQHGKHVLCEKPMATSLRETTEMVESARRNGVVLMEALKTTLTPNFISVYQNLHRIGTIRRYFAQYCQYSSRYDKLKEGIVLNAFDPKMAGGALLDLGVYCLYPMVALFGKHKSWLCSGELLSTGVDGYGSVICRYDGFDAVSIYSKLSDSTLPSEIQGEKGSIVIEKINTFDRVTIHWRDGSIEDISRKSVPDNMYYELSEMITLIESSDSMESQINSLQTTLTVAQLMEGVRKTIGVSYPSDDETPAHVSSL